MLNNSITGQPFAILVGKHGWYNSRFEHKKSGKELHKLLVLTHLVVNYDFDHFTGFENDKQNYST